MFKLLRRKLNTVKLSAFKHHLPSLSTVTSMYTGTLYVDRVNNNLQLYTCRVLI